MAKDYLMTEFSIDEYKVETKTHKYLDELTQKEVTDTYQVGKFAGFGSVFDVVDSDSDVIVKGAFKKSLRKRTPSMLWQHKMQEPIGVYTSLKETSEGLVVEGEINLEVQQGREAFSLLKQGALTGLSVGFITKGYDIDSKRRVRTIKEADLFEISLVTFPANDSARITSVKSFSEMTTREVESKLRDVFGLSQSEAKAFMAKGFDALQEQREVAKDGDSVLEAFAKAFA